MSIFKTKRLTSLFVLACTSMVSVGSLVGVSFNHKHINETDAFTNASLNSKIDLNDADDTTIRKYYKNITNTNGDNLLIELKERLKLGQEYHTYDSGKQIWKAYEICDRDWELSPASEIPTYNSETNQIDDYSYVTKPEDLGPYVRTLYLNRDKKNICRAYGNHAQSLPNDFQREHVWPKSIGMDENDPIGNGPGARGDLMHLWPGNGYVNNKHKNHHYGYIDKKKDYEDLQKLKDNVFVDMTINGNYVGKSLTYSTYDGPIFEPQDSDKGDIARACFYMVARYNYLSGKDENPINCNNPNLALARNIDDLNKPIGYSDENNVYYLGIKEDLLAWNRLDPPDEYEIHRNNLLYNNYTKNRNPFIDFPSWADHIWGDKKNVNIDPKTDPINTFEPIEIIKVNDVKLNINSLTLKEGETKQLIANVLPSNATNKFVKFSSSDSAMVLVDETGLIKANKEGTATITVTTDDGGFIDTCIVNVEKQPSSGGGEITPPTPTPIGEKTTVYGPSSTKAKLTDISDGLYYISAPKSDGTGEVIFDLNKLSSSPTKPTNNQILTPTLNNGFIRLKKDKNSESYAISNPEETAYLAYGSSTDLKTTQTPNYWTITQDNQTKRFGNIDSDLFKICSVNTPDRGLIYSDSNGYDTFGAYKTSNLTGKNYTGLYLYKIHYALDELVKELTAMNCEKMLNADFNNKITSIYKSLTKAEKDMLLTLNITGSDGKTYTADYAYNYALKYNANNKTNRSYLTNVNQSEQIIFYLILSLSCLSIVTLTYFLFSKRKKYKD